ncbi:hypothetical protein K435DRAFT_856666 [Dendrothele bispora CBS 962.96]|uniref:Uncharacterized protein n=1 Tax=Dendrothele bispora (strain CBS 962.96) TaxID=1314807 RepID=A0A4S8M7V5_DENBC|nr:hypothetical protein K435DRAFT_856666 [Dendrothele bispora CBS 962.96]
MSSSATEPASSVSTRVDSIDARKSSHALPATSASETKGATTKEPKKRGNKGNFHGKHLEYLEKELPGWLKSSKKEKTLWITRFFDRWFKQFRWHLDSCPEEFLNVEPVPAPTTEDSLAVMPATPISAGMTEEEFIELSGRRDKERDQVMVVGKKQLSTWFHRQTGKAKSMVGAGVFSDLMKELCTVSHSPRRPIPYKYYMNHPDYVEKCRAAFQEEWKTAGLEKSQRLHFQCKVAQRLYMEEDDETRQMLEEEALEEYETSMKAYQELTNGNKLTLDSLTEFGELPKEICRQNLTKFMLPMLELLRKATDLSFVMIAGKPPAPGGAVDDFELITVSAGTTVGPDPKKFEEFDREAFTKHVIGQFMLFLMETVEDVNADATKIDDSTVARAIDKAAKKSDPQNWLDDPSLLQMSGNDEEETEKSKTRKLASGKKKTSGEKVANKEKSQMRVPSDNDDEKEEDNLNNSGDDEGKEKTPESQPERPRPRPKPRLRANTPTLPDGWVLHDETKLYLDALSPEERRKELVQIRGHSKADFDRGNNIARIKQMRKEVDQRCEERLKTRGREPSTNRIPATTPTVPSQLPSSIGPPASDSDAPISDAIPSPSTPTLVAAAGSDCDAPMSGAILSSSTPAPGSDSSVPTPDTILSPSTAVLVSKPEEQTAPPGSDSDPPTSSAFLSLSTPKLTSTNEVQEDEELPDGSGIGLTDEEPTEELAERMAVEGADVSSGLDGEPTAERMAVGDANVNSGSTPSELSVDRTGWPSWLTSAFEVFTGTEELKAKGLWRDLLVDWVELERKYAFENPGGPGAFYTKVGRPNLVEWWSRFSRKKVRAETPNVMPTGEEFAKSFKEWWSALNPDWRERDVLDGSLHIDVRVEPKEKGMWESMKKPGQCGILTWLLCLFHWFNVLNGEEQAAEWEEVLADVQWVVGCMNKAAKKPPKRKAPGNTEEDLPTKRLRSSQASGSGTA